LRGTEAGRNPGPAVPSNAMAFRPDYRRTLKPALAAGAASHVVEQRFMGQTTIAVNPPGA